jgi:hypothetical protein
VLINFFDFPVRPNDQPRQKSTTIAFTGNLVSAPFVQELHQIPGLTFLVYGTGNKTPLTPSDRVLIKGVQSPEQLAGTVEGSFGLVWNGDTATTLAGPAGAYLRINSPHKLSSYIISGLPVIAPKDSAAGKLVTELSLGFTVDSIYEIEEGINRLSEEEYRNMQEHCFEQANLISSGGGIKKALRELGLLMAYELPAQNDAQ